MTYNDRKVLEEARRLLELVAMNLPVPHESANQCFMSLGRMIERARKDEDL